MTLKNYSVIALFLILILSSTAFGQQTECKDIDKIFQAQAKSVAESDVYESAKTCAVCHESYYKDWKSSLMGQTHSSKIYQIIREEAVKTMGDSVVENCNKCHMPMIDLSKDASDDLLAQGVNCDFCHTIDGTEFYQDPGSYISQPSRVKKGSLDMAKSPYHPTETSDVVGSPRFCASCHEYQINEGGRKLIIEDTYTQYKDSSYGKTNRSCLACHMVKFEGKVASLNLAPRRKNGHSHDFGIKDKAKFISDAVGIRIKPFVKKARNIELMLNNKAQGHAFPGGANYFRQLIVTVRGYDNSNKQVWAYSTVFGRWFEDRFGNKTYFPWKAKKMAYNRLLRPDRLETATFNITKRIKVYKVAATIDYWYMPPELVRKYKLNIKPIRVAQISARPSDY